MSSGHGWWCVRCDVGDGRLEFVLPAGDDIAIAANHRVESDPCHIDRVVLFGMADLGVEHVNAFEESGFG